MCVCVRRQAPGGMTAGAVGRGAQEPDPGGPGTLDCLSVVCTLTCVQIGQVVGVSSMETEPPHPGGPSHWSWWEMRQVCSRAGERVAGCPISSFLLVHLSGHTP